MTAIDVHAEAARRGWTFAAKAEPPPITGAVFGAITGGVVTNLVSGAGFEFGIIAGFVGGSRTEQYGTVTVTMNVATPVPVAVLGGRAVRQASRYRDDKAPPDETVSSAARRLDQGALSRRGVLIGAVIALVVSLGLTAGWIVLMVASILPGGG